MRSQSRTNHHTFVICAYKESPYLAECIESLMDQSLKSKVIMVTSTPCEYLKGMAERYHIPLYVNSGKSGITEDWNYGLSLVETKLATIAHQDDITVFSVHPQQQFRTPGTDPPQAVILDA